MVVHTPWPKADPALTRQDSVTIAVQVNGKLRDTIEMARDLDAKAVEAAVLALESVRKAIDGKPVKKVIIVPNRIANVVV
jgi:leucyl-tRNA synthetase